MNVAVTRLQKAGTGQQKSAKEKEQEEALAADQVTCQQVSHMIS